MTLKASRIDKDPTKQSGNRRRAMTDINKRLNGAYRDVIALYTSMPKEFVANRVTYRYLLDDFRLQSTDERIRQIINDWFDTATDTRPPNFWFNRYIGFAYDMGTKDSADRIALLGMQAGVLGDFELSQLDIENIYQQPLYRRRIELVYGRAFNEMKGFSGTTATDLARILSQVVADGRSPRDAQRMIKKRFSVARSRAERIARTEINRSYNVARSENNEDIKRRLEIDIRVAHRSSLVPTTRLTHGARHGKIYSMQDQQDWWDEGANRINCLCSTTEVVFDKKGKPFDNGLVPRMEKQRKSWFPSG